MLAARLVVRCELHHIDGATRRSLRVAIGWRDLLARRTHASLHSHLFRAFLEAVALPALSALVLVHLPAALLHDAVEGELLALRQSVARFAQKVSVRIVVRLSLWHECCCYIGQDSPWLTKHAGR